MVRSFFGRLSWLHCKRKLKTTLVEGNIASGKTEFLTFFADKRPEKVELFAEPLERWRNIRNWNGLDLFYEDPVKWGFLFQSYVQLTQLDSHVCQQKKQVKMMERSLFSAKYCFVEKLYQSKMIQDVEYAVLTEWFDWILKNHNIHVDLIVYLRTKPETVHRRLLSRNRPEERAVSLAYLEEIHEMHEDWLIRKKFPLPGPVMVIEADADLPEMLQEYNMRAKQILDCEIFRGTDRHLIAANDDLEKTVK